jgi:hypothetical protein
MVDELEGSRPPILLLDESVADMFERENDSRIPGSTILDAFIADRYRPMCSFGDFRVLALVGPGLAAPPCPDPAGQP